MSSTTLRMRLFLGVSLVLTVFAVACQEQEQEQEEWFVPHSMGPSMSAERPECPVTWDTVPLFGFDGSRRRTRTHSEDSLPVRTSAQADDLVPTPGKNGAASFLSVDPPKLLGDIIDTPEFNDCQRFIVEKNGKMEYSDLFAIFAARDLEAIGSRLMFSRVEFTSSSRVVSTDSVGIIKGVNIGSAMVRVVSRDDSTLRAVVNVSVQPKASRHGRVVNVRPGDSISVEINPGDTTRVVPLPGPTKQTLPLAQIYTYGTGYPPLGIGPNFNCLLVYYDPSSQLRAKMIQGSNSGADRHACSAPIDPRTRGIELKVVATLEKPSLASPPVARWVTDPINRQQYIGIKCGTQWCEIGAPGADGQFHQADTVPFGKLPAQERRVLAGRGWYDAQFLAYVDKNGIARPTQVMGLVIPAPDLGMKTADFYRASPWVTSAYIAMWLESPPGIGVTKSANPFTVTDEDAVRYYMEKLNFDTVRVGRRLEDLNQLAVCFGTRAACKIPSSVNPLKCPSTVNQMGLKKGRWWSRIISASKKNTIYRCDTRRAMDSLPPPIPVPATARWRWLLRDETIWEECTQGCCEVRAAL